MNNLKALREAKGLTQEDVAKVVGVSRVAVLKWENHQSIPNAKYVPKLAQLLKCSVDDILRLYA